MYLTKHLSADGPRWALDGRFLPPAISLAGLLQIPLAEMARSLRAQPLSGVAVGTLVAPIEADHEVWAAGVTYLRSREAREAESCALGPGIQISNADSFRDLAIDIEIVRAGRTAFAGGTRTSRMRRSFDELVSYLVRELDFPRGVFLMTGTGIVPPPEYTLSPGDRVRVTAGSLTLENDVERAPRIPQR
jgi:2-dehydro-3-deoxy-D-arabinonate dehydratase